MFKVYCCINNEVRLDYLIRDTINGAHLFVNNLNRLKTTELTQSDFLSAEYVDITERQIIIKLDGTIYELVAESNVKDVKDILGDLPELLI